MLRRARLAGRRAASRPAVRRGLGVGMIAASFLTAWALGPTGAPGSAQAEPNGIAVTLRVDGEDRALTTQAVCVAELVASQGIALGPEDETNPALDAALSDGMTVVVKRVIQSVVRRQIEIPPPVVTRRDRRMGRPVVLHPGRPGLADAVVEVRYRDGVETEQRVISQTVIRKPESKIVVAGSRKLPSRGGQMLVMEATGYDPGPRSCGRFASGRTAIGMKAGKGVVAVDPRVIPLGTRLHIEGYGRAVAGDVGSAIKGRRIDLGFDTYKEAINWGRRTVRVRILE